MQTGDLAVIIPARNEADRIADTVMAAATLGGADIVVVVDDGSTDGTALAAEAAGAQVIRHSRNRGKAAAMETGARAVQRIERTAGPHHLLFLDADLADSAVNAGPLVDPIRAGTADVTIAVFTSRVRKGGFGIVTATAGAGIERAVGWRPAQPLNGQRCLTRAAFEAALPLAHGWGVETGMTIDLARKGMRIIEVEVPLSHRATGNDWRAQLHRLHQLADVTRALLSREPVTWRARRAGARRTAG
ncbi:MAG TPA: glycosyltransferase family 2 protein [Streptosporangiaceae bacterium]|jgi:glycosyltransferase involved in cell wall biosynthesis